MSAADQLRSITRNGYERLHAQLGEPVSVRRAELARLVGDARNSETAPDETLAATRSHAEVVDYDVRGYAGIRAHVRLRMASATVMQPRCRQATSTSAPAEMT